MASDDSVWSGLDNIATIKSVLIQWIYKKKEGALTSRKDQIEKLEMPDRY